MHLIRHVSLSYFSISLNFFFFLFCFFVFSISFPAFSSYYYSVAASVSTLGIINDPMGMLWWNVVYWIQHSINFREMIILFFLNLLLCYNEINSLLHVLLLGIGFYSQIYFRKIGLLFKSLNFFLNKSLV